MRIVVFGATGPTGLEVVEQALDAGHDVIAIVRTPSKLTLEHERLILHRGDALDLGSFADALNGADVVVSALGVKPSREPVSFYSESAAAIVEGMRASGVSRLICVTAAALKPNDPNLPLFFKYILKPLLFQRLYDDMIRMEAFISESGVDYTFVRPPRLLDGPARQTYRAEEAYSLPGGAKINRADVAHYIVAHLDDPELINKGVAVAY